MSGDEWRPDLPDVPTYAEAGVPGFNPDLWHGLVVSKDVPRPIVDKLNADVDAALKAREIVARLKADGTSPIGVRPNTSKR